jgi:putative Ig domain-containing protein
MLRRKNSLVSALLPILPLAFCQGCGSGASEPSPAGEVPTGSVVTPANQAPSVVARVDETVRVGQSYDAQTVANDADGDRLTYSAGNLPPWASIDTNNGRITGTPAAQDVGVYESITISVTDTARHVTTTRPFSITVVGNAGRGVASLRWELPPSKMDGSPLNDLAGYRILYGRHSNDLDQSVFIGDAAATSYEIDSLGEGVWYFAVIAINASGLEGPPTTVASKSI